MNAKPSRMRFAIETVTLNSRREGSGKKRTQESLDVEDSDDALSICRIRIELCVTDDGFVAKLLHTFGSQHRHRPNAERAFNLKGNARVFAAKQNQMVKNCVVR